MNRTQQHTPHRDPLVARTFNQKPAWAKRWELREAPEVLTIKSHLVVGIVGHGVTICAIPGGAPFPGINGNLLAAAPDLLAALRDMLTDRDSHGAICRTDPCAACRARAAIAKAEGKS